MKEICYSEEWKKYSSIAAGLIPIYPIGIPLLIFSCLWKSRYRLQDPSIRGKYGFFYDFYQSHRWPVELLDFLHKFFLTSVLLFFPPVWSLSLGLSLSGLYLILLYLSSPYLRNSDDRMHLYGQSCLILIIMAGNNLYWQTEYNPFYDQIISTVLILIILIFLLYFLGQGVSAWRRWKIEKQQWQEMKRKIKEKALENIKAMEKPKFPYDYPVHNPEDSFQPNPAYLLPLPAGAVEMVEMPSEIHSATDSDVSHEEHRPEEKNDRKALSTANRLLSHKEKAGHDELFVSAVESGILIHPNNPGRVAAAVSLSQSEETRTRGLTNSSLIINRSSPSPSFALSRPPEQLAQSNSPGEGENVYHSAQARIQALLDDEEFKAD